MGYDTQVARAARVVLFLVAGFATICLAGCGGGGGSNPPCNPVVSPAADVTSGTSATTPGTFEGEIAIAEDPNNGAVYVATIEAVKAPQVPVPGTSAGQNNNQNECLIEKQIRVYRSQQGAGWTLIPSSVNLGTAQALGGSAGPIWVTDPWLDVASDGTVYLSVFFTPTTNNCATPAPAPLNDAQEEVQLWVLPPGGVFTQVGLNTAGASVISAGTNRSSAIGAILDHPRMAVNPTNPGEVVLTFIGFASPSNIPDQVRTLRRDNLGNYALASTGLTQVPIGAGNFPNPAFDAQGNLYIASAATTTGPTVFRFTKNPTTLNWDPAGSSAPAASLPSNNSTNLLTAFGKLLPIDPTPTLELVGNPATLFMAYTVDTSAMPAGGAIDPGVEFAQVDATTLTGWSTPIRTVRSRAWAQDMGIDSRTNTLDLAYYSLDGPSSGADATNVVMNSYFERRDSQTPTTVTVNPVAVSNSPPALADLPGRSQGDIRVFPGEYLAMATNGDKAFMAFPNTTPGGGTYPTTGTATPNANVDLAFSLLDEVCSTIGSTKSPLTLKRGGPDTRWECDCDCGGTVSVMTGCAPDGVSSAADACQYVCVGSDCGMSLSCSPAGRQCASTGTGRALLGDSCAATFGPASGAQPSFFADYFAQLSGSAVFHFSGDSASTGVNASMSLNAATNPPVAGAAMEIARLTLSPSSFDVGGFVGARVESITLTHNERLRGQFTSATQFVIPEGRAQFSVRFRVNPDGPSWLTGDTTTTHLIVANTAPIVGTLDPVAGTASLELALGDADEGFEGSLSGVLTAAPVDTDGDGIFDGVDNCPEVYNPDQVDAPPEFVGLQNARITLCNPGDEISFEPPIATDVCTPNEVRVEGVVVEINGQPFDPGIYLDGNVASLPAGSLVVEWTATDGNGNETVALQQVEVFTRPSLYTTESMNLGDRTRVVFGDTFGAVFNSGSDELNLGVEAEVGDTRARGEVVMRDRSEIHGFVKTEQSVVEQSDTTIDGTTQEMLAVLFPEEPFLSDSFPAWTEEVHLEPNTQQSLSAGSFGPVTVKSGAELTLGGGDYYFESLQVEPDATITLDETRAPIRLFVEQSLIFRGSFNHLDGISTDLFVGYVGTAGAFLEAPVDGRVVVPNAELTLGSYVPVAFSGEFFAKSIVTRPDVTVTHVAFECSSVVQEPLEETCSDGVFNQNESDVDCGGTCGATCLTGADCNANEDCVSDSCVMGVCNTPAGSCSEASAQDMGGHGASITVSNNACLRVRDGYPDWWGTRLMQLQTLDGGSYPIPYTWESTCTGGGGSGLITGDWQSHIVGPTSDECATVISLAGNGLGLVSLRYYAN